MSISNKTKTIIFNGSIIVIFLAIIGYGKLYRNSIKTNHEISNCHIDEIRRVGREQYILIKYHFSLGRKVYKSEASFSQAMMSDENAKLLEDKNFPVAYNKKFGCMLSHILIFPDDYKEFNVRYPDSLKWVLPLIKKY